MNFRNKFKALSQFFKSVFKRRQKIILPLSAVLLIGIVAMSLVFTNMYSEKMLHERNLKHENILVGLAKISSDYLGLEEIKPLTEIFSLFQERNDDIRYIIINKYTSPEQIKYNLSAKNLISVFSDNYSLAESKKIMRRFFTTRAFFKKIVSFDMVTTSELKKIEDDYKRKYLGDTFELFSFIFSETVVVGTLRIGFSDKKFKEEITALDIMIFSLSGGFLILGIMLFVIIRDIAERKKAEEKLVLAAKVFENTLEGIIICDVDGRIQSVNKAFTTITGYNSQEVMGKEPSLLKSGKHDVDFYERLWASLLNTGQWQGEIWNRNKKGEIYPEWLNISVIKDDQQEITNFVAVFSDITKIKLSQERLNFLAYHDPLTELPNRTLFYDRLQQEMRHADRNNSIVGLMFLDLDNFKIINDSLGHTTGDLLLRKVAERLKTYIRESDTIARLGGDEFTMIISDIKNGGVAAKIAEKILEGLLEKFQVVGNKLVIGASIGIALYPYDGREMETLIKNADIAMYHAKEQGRNNFQFFSNAMNEKFMKRLNLERDMQKAVKKEEFRLRYQPQFDLKTEKLTGIEALVYWQRGEQIVWPDEFIQIAEETGLIVPLGEWILRQACKQNKSWQDSGFQPVPIAVNISARQFQHGDLVETIDAILAQTGLDGRYLELELTERVVIQDIKSTEITLRELKKRGIKIAIDDFGTGHSSLSNLKHFPIDKIKIDRSFVRDMLTNPADAAIINAIIVMGDSLNVQVIAEGVENREQASLLENSLCNSIQGFFFSHPLNSDEIKNLFLKQRDKFS